MKTICCVVVVLIAFTSAVANAQTAQQADMFPFGVGLQTCGEWTQARLEQHRDELAGIAQVLAISSWVQGFMWGMEVTVAIVRNIAKGEPKTTLASINLTTLQAWLDKHCSDLPLHKIHEAALDLTDELRKQQSSQQPKR
jgi:hypothetical protein